MVVERKELPKSFIGELFTWPSLGGSTQRKGVSPTDEGRGLPWSTRRSDWARTDSTTKHLLAEKTSDWDGWGRGRKTSGEFSPRSREIPQTITREKKDNFS